MWVHFKQKMGSPPSLDPGTCQAFLDKSLCKDCFYGISVLLHRSERHRSRRQRSWHAARGSNSQVIFLYVASSQKNRSAVTVEKELFRCPFWLNLTVVYWFLCLFTVSNLILQTRRSSVMIWPHRRAFLIVVHLSELANYFVMAISFGFRPVF